MIFALLLLLSFTSVTAQTTSVYQAFVMNGPLDRLTFIDVLTGAQTTFDLDGDRYTLINGGVLFFDRTTNRVRTAAPSGTLRDHPFVQLSGDARRIDWALSGDQIVWTLTSGATPTLTTTTYAANLDGSNERQVFADSQIAILPEPRSCGLVPDRIGSAGRSSGSRAPRRKTGGRFRYWIGAPQARWNRQDGRCLGALSCAAV